jgi:4-amino-4-deoxy-L-arabinose transferase-like glycosyltransferase
MKNRIIEWIFVVAIVLVAFFARFYKVTEVPPSLNWDETSIAYNAYSIMQTGKDEWGVKYPLNFKSYGEYKLPVQIYASIPGIKLFGLNELGVRITPVVYGTLTILLLFLLTKELFGSKIALISSFFLAISPWHIQLTRASFESSFSVFWVLMGLWFLIKGLKKPAWWIAAVFPFAVAVYTYNSARIFTPLIILAFGIIYFKKILPHWKTILIAGAIFVALMSPVIVTLFNGEAAARYKLVSITDDKGLIPRIEQQRNLSTYPKVITNLIHNRFTYIGYYVARNYLAHFSPDFLFINGAGHKQHHPQKVGEMFFIQAPFVILGIVLLLKKKNKYNGLLFSWLLLAFVPVSITNDSIPHALRTIIAAPVYQIFTGIGIYEAINYLKGKKKWFGVVGITIATLISVYLYYHHLIVDYSRLYSQAWQYGYKQAVSYIKDNSSKYDLVIFTRGYGEPHMFSLFYLGYSPEKYQNAKKIIQVDPNSWIKIYSFDNFRFPDLSEPGTMYEDMIRENPGKKILFIGKHGDFPDDIKVLKNIKFLDGQDAFDIVEKK